MFCRLPLVPAFLALAAALAAALICGPACGPVHAQPGQDVAVYPFGTVDLRLSAADDEALARNAQRRGNSPFSHLQANLFADIAVGDRLVVFNQITLDPSARAPIHSYLRTWARYTVLVRDGFDLHLQGGKIPTPFGHFTERAYSDKNPLLGYPLMYHHFSSLRADLLPTSNADLLAHRGEGPSETFAGYGGSGSDLAGLPLIYDSCWDFGGGIIGSVWRFEYLLAVTQGALSDPRANAVDTNDGVQLAARLGWVPMTGVLVRLSWARAPYLRDTVASQLPAGRQVEDYLQEIVGVAAELEWRHLAVVAEVAANRWASPYITDGAGAAADLEVDGGYLEARWKLGPGWYLAGRVGALRFGDIAAGAGTARTWDHDVERVEVGSGYWLTDGVLTKLVAQWSDVGPGDDTRIVATSLMVRF